MCNNGNCRHRQHPTDVAMSFVRHLFHNSPSRYDVINDIHLVDLMLQLETFRALDIRPAKTILLEQLNTTP